MAEGDLARRRERWWRKSKLGECAFNATPLDRLRRFAGCDPLNGAWIDVGNDGDSSGGGGVVNGREACCLRHLVRCTHLS